MKCFLNFQVYKLNKKLLIFIPASCKITDGGPSGFCANNFVDVESNIFDFAYLGNIISKNTFLDTQLNNLKKKLRIYPKYIEYPEVYFWIRSLFKNCINQSYEFVMFHDVETLAFCSDLLYKHQKAILQPHCPELPSEEVLGIDEKKYKQLCEAEKIAFDKCDLIFLPNEEVTPIYKKLIVEGKVVKYILSGLKPREIESKINLGNDKINFLYIGRKNKIKGFDIIINAFKVAYNQNNNIQLYVIGHGKSEIHPAIIDVGFSDNVLLWINSVDYVLNANRQSYFDLSFLETINIGTPFIFSKTNGHIHFTNYNTEGLIPFDINENLSNVLIGVIKNHDKINNSGIKKKNRQIFLEEYTNEKYIQRFEMLIKEL